MSRFLFLTFSPYFNKIKSVNLYNLSFMDGLRSFVLTHVQKRDPVNGVLVPLDFCVKALKDGREVYLRVSSKKFQDDVAISEEDLKKAVAGGEFIEILPHSRRLLTRGDEIYLNESGGILILFQENYLSAKTQCPNCQK